LKNITEKYINELIKKNPKIASGRKNFKFYKLRINRTIKLISKYFKNTNN